MKKFGKYRTENNFIGPSK